MPRRFISRSWYHRHSSFIGYVLLAAAVAVLYVRVYILANETHVALCTVRAGYVHSRAETEHLLHTQHGPVIHYAGLSLSRSALQRSVLQQTIQINGLRRLEC